MEKIGLELSKFTLVGLINTALDIVIFNLIKKFTKSKTVVASYISSTVAMVNSYVLNKYWTFSAANSNSQGVEALKFFFSTIIGIYVLHNGVVWLLSEKFPFFGDIAYAITSRLPILKKLSKEFVHANVAKVGGIATSLVWNFTLYKFWVFK